MGIMDVIAPIISPLIKTGQGDIESADQQRQAMLNEALGLSVPDREKLMLSLKDYAAKDIYNPEREQAQQLAGGYYDEAKTSPEMRAKQMEYMKTLEDVSKTGMTAQEEGQKNQLMRQLAGQQQSAAADIERQMQSKGMGSSGASLLAKLQGQQQAQSNAAQQSENLLGQMFQRKLGAAGQASDLAGNIDQTDFQRAMNLGQAKQGIDTFNAQQRANAQQRNVAASNLAKEADWRNQQNIANQNVGNRQAEEQARAASYRQDYANRLKKLGITTDARQAEADYRTARGQATQQETLGGLKAVGTLASMIPSGGAGGAATGASAGGAADAVSSGMGSYVAAHGGRIPGIPIVENDSYLNDNVDVKMSPGELVIPRSAAMSKHDAIKFIHEHFNKQAEKLK